MNQDSLLGNSSVSGEDQGSLESASSQETTDIHSEFHSNQSDILLKNLDLNSPSKNIILDPVKIFIGQVPHTYNEDDLQKEFEHFGTIIRSQVIRDRKTGVHKGCGFITFAEGESALHAIQEFHNKKILPGMKHPMQIKEAASDGKLSISPYISVQHLPPTTTEEQVHDLFDCCGEILEIEINGNDNKMPIVIIKTEMAIKAIQMYNRVIPPGLNHPLKVKHISRENRSLYGIHSSTNSPVAKKNSNIFTEDSNSLKLYEIHSPVKNIENVQLRSPRFSSKPKLKQNQSSYNNKLSSPQTSYPLPVFSIPPLTMGSPLMTSEKKDLNENTKITPTNQIITSKMKGPPGANLFIYHLPQQLNDDDLITIFEPFGHILSSRVFIDKLTHESRGFGFVSFSSVEEAQKAIQYMNGFHIGNKRLKVQQKREKNTEPEIQSPSMSNYNSHSLSTSDHSQIPPLSYPFVMPTSSSLEQVSAPSVVPNSSISLFQDNTSFSKELDPSLSSYNSSSISSFPLDSSLFSPQLDQSTIDFSSSNQPFSYPFDSMERTRIY